MFGRTNLLLVLCVALLQCPLLAQSAYQGHNLEHNLIFPVFLMGGPDGFSTRLLLSNPEPGRQVSGTLYVFGQDGTPIRVYRDPMGDEGPSVGLGVFLAAGGSRTVDIFPEKSDLTVGWALLDLAADPVMRSHVAGSAATTYKRADGTRGLVGVVAASYEPGKHKRISIPVWLTDGVDVGVALVNAGTAPVNVTCELRDQIGTVVRSTANAASPISTLEPGHQVALFVSEIFDFHVGNQVFDGSLLISTEQEGLEAVGLLSYGGELTSIPTVHFALVDSGAGYWDYASSGLTDLKVKALAVDPANPDTVYAGTTSKGVFKSTNAGTSWSQTGLTDGAVDVLSVDPSNPNTVYAGTEAKGLMKSTDAGASWNNTSLPISVSLLSVDPRNSSHLLAAYFSPVAVSGGGGTSLFNSTDGGASWTPVNLPRSDFLALDPFNPDYLYATQTGLQDEFSSLSRSTDGGASWSQVPQCCHDVGVINRITVEPGNPTTLYGQGYGNPALRSTDGGATWKRIDFPISTIVQDTHGTGTLYAVASGYVYRSADHGVTWIPINHGLALGVQTLAASRSQPTALFAATNGNGVFKYVP